MELSPTDIISMVLSFFFTIFILSYVVGDSPLFRLAVHVFIGVTAGYVFAVVLRQVFFAKLFMPMLTDSSQIGFLIVPTVLGMLLMTKMFSSIEWIGRPVVAFMVGVGTATAIAGAILGTLFPQIGASAEMFALGQGGVLQLFSGAFILIGTIFTLAYFQFTVKAGTGGQRGRIGTIVATVGQVFIAITLGAIFAGVLAAALTAFVGSIQNLVIPLDLLRLSATSLFP